MTWYLDIVSPGWKGVVYGDYTAVMPLPVKFKVGLPLTLQPFLCQQLGIFSSEKLSDNLIKEFYLKLNRHYPTTYNVNLFNTPQLPPGLRLDKLPNTELTLNKNHAELRDEFSKNTRRNITKAKKEGLITEELLPEENVFSFIFKNLRFSFSAKEQDLFRQVVLKSFSRNEGVLLACKNDNRELLSVGFFIIHKRRITFLGSSSSKDGYIKQAAFLIFDTVIEKYSAKDFVLDFEGSKNEGIARFYKGFGGAVTQYGQISNRSFDIYKSGLEVAQKIITLFSHQP